MLFIFSYATLVRLYLSAGRNSLRNLTAFDILFYKLTRVFEEARQRENVAVLNHFGGIKVDSVLLSALMPGSYRIGEVLANDAVLRWK